MCDIEIFQCRAICSWHFSLSEIVMQNFSVFFFFFFFSVKFAYLMANSADPDQLASEEAS